MDVKYGEIKCDLCSEIDDGIRVEKIFGLISFSICESCLSDIFKKLGDNIGEEEQ